MHTLCLLFHTITSALCVAVDTLFFLFILVILENDTEFNVLTFDCQSMKSEQSLPRCTYLAVKSFLRGNVKGGENVIRTRALIILTTEQHLSKYWAKIDPVFNRALRFACNLKCVQYIELLLFLQNINNMKSSKHSVLS